MLMLVVRFMLMLLWMLLPNDGDHQQLWRFASFGHSVGVNPEISSKRTRISESLCSFCYL